MRKGLIVGAEAITMSRHMLRTKTNNDLGAGYKETIIETLKRRITLLFLPFFQIHQVLKNLVLQ